MMRELERAHGCCQCALEVCLGSLDIGLIFTGDRLSPFAVSADHVLGTSRVFGMPSVQSIIAPKATCVKEPNQAWLDTGSCAIIGSSRVTGREGMSFVIWPTANVVVDG